LKLAMILRRQDKEGCLSSSRENPSPAIFPGVGDFWKRLLAQFSGLGVGRGGCCRDIMKQGRGQMEQAG